MQQQNTVSDMYSLLGSFMKPYTELMELSAIWIRGNRIATGDEVYYDGDEVLIIGKLTSHRVVKCMGNINSSRLEMELENLDTQEHITIKL